MKAHNCFASNGGRVWGLQNKIKLCYDAKRDLFKKLHEFSTTYQLLMVSEILIVG